MKRIHEMKAHLAAMIQNIGGFSDRGTRYAIAFFYEPWADVSDFAECLARSDEYRDAEKDAVYKKAVKLGAEKWARDVEKGTIHEWIISDMQDTVTDSDCFRYVSAEVANIYGIPEDTSFDANLEFVSDGYRQYVVLSEFEGHSLECSTDDLVDFFHGKGEEGESIIPNSLVPYLLAYLEQLRRSFDSAALNDEYKYQAGFQAAQRMEELTEKARVKLAKKALKKAVRRAHEHLEYREILDCVGTYFDAAREDAARSLQA